MRARWTPVLAAALGLTLAGAAPAQAPAEPPEVRFTVRAFEVSGDNPLSPATTQSVLAPYTGEHAGFAGLEAAADALQSALGAAGYPFHRVNVPPQKVTGGSFRLEVLSFTLGAVTVSGNEHFSEDNIRRSLPKLVPGEAPSRRAFEASMTLANQHPAKQVRVRIRESTEPDKVDAVVAVKDRRPYQAFATFSNRGSDETGPTRATIGFQHSNLFDLDHSATVTATASPGRVGDVWQMGGFYRMPLYDLGASVDLYAVRSSVDTGTVARFFEVSGQGTFAGARYTQILPGQGSFRHDVSVSLDDRDFENNVNFLGTPLGNDVRSRPVGVRYQGGWRTAGFDAGFHAGYAHNLGGGSNNDQASYTAARAGADSGWDVFRAGARADVQSGPWLVRARAGAQIASEELIPGEQYGIGGASSVRGYEEREATGDSGFQANAEIWTPPVYTGLRLLAFLDYGHARFESPVAGVSRTTLSSFGLGARYSYAERLSASVDVARVFNDGPETESGDIGGHLRVVYRFW